MEYQKSCLKHNTKQRPDIILHIPTEISNSKVSENNFSIWALKLNANQNKAKEDFRKLDIMFSDPLNYQLGFFINIDSKNHHFNSYDGKFKDRLHTFSVKLIKENISIIHAFLNNEGSIEVRNIYVPS